MRRQGPGQRLGHPTQGQRQEGPAKETETRKEPLGGGTPGTERILPGLQGRSQHSSWGRGETWDVLLGFGR